METGMKKEGCIEYSQIGDGYGYGRRAARHVNLATKSER
jgi:hypothetical protein